MSKYIPISCSFYDELEAAAVKKVYSKIVYKHNDEKRIIEGYVVDFKNINKEEFMILKDGTSIRLDMIIRFNDLTPQDKDYC